MKRDLAEAVLGTTAALVVVLDRSGRVVRFNAACERLTGYREAEVTGQPLWPLVLGAPEAAQAAAIYAQIDPGRPVGQYEDCWMGATGERHYISWAITHLLGVDGEIELVVATGLDVTQERQTRLEREESETRFRALFERSGDGVVLTDPHDLLVPWRIVDCNAAFARMNGYTREALVGQTIDVLHQDALMAREGAELLKQIRTQGDDALGEGTHRHQNGSLFSIETRSSVIVLGGQELVLGIDRDVSERKRTEAQLRALNDRLTHDAHHDALTGLPNRALLYDRLAVELARMERSATSLAVLFIDLDDFKRVNDTLGHAAGDRLLQEVAQRLGTVVRPSDKVARMGGDEFVVVVPELASGYDVMRLVQRIQSALAVPFGLGGQQLILNPSIGITVAPADGRTADALLSQADIAMYQAKREGKNDLRFFSPDLTARAIDQTKVEGRLRAAIHGQNLTLHYQPQFGVVSGRLVGLEALLRWTDTELGVVTPDRFIPVAEDTGLIVPLGAWVLNEACRQIAEWGLSVPVSVNVSPAQLIRLDFMETVRSALYRHGLRGTTLKLELTERLVLREPLLAARRLEALQSLGVRISIDDFGAGQAGLGPLLVLPVDEVKLDRALISGLGDDAASRRVVAALLALARGLGLPVVGEGVETEAQLRALRDLGCDAVQGFLTGRPAAPASLKDLIEAGKIEAGEEACRNSG